MYFLIVINTKFIQVEISSDVEIVADGERERATDNLSQKMIPYYIEVDEGLEQQSHEIELESIAGDGDKGASDGESVRQSDKNELESIAGDGDKGASDGESVRQSDENELESIAGDGDKGASDGESVRQSDKNEQESIAGDGDKGASDGESVRQSDESELESIAGDGDKGRKRYLTRSSGTAPPFSKRICKGDGLY